MIAALFILAFLFLLPLFSSTLRESRFILITYLFVVLLHQAVAISTLYITPLIGSVGDAVTFHLIAEGLVSHPIENAHLYSHFLAMVYKVFGVSQFLGEQLSIMAFSISCVVFLKLKLLLDFTRYSALSLLAFGALPTMVLLGSVTLRESFEILFFMLAAYYGLRVLARGGINLWVIPMVFTALLLGLTHKGLYFYAFFFIALVISWDWCSNILRTRKDHPYVITAWICVVAISIIFIPIVFGWKATSETLFPHAFADTLIRYAGATDLFGPARADYDGLNVTSLVGLVLSGFRLYFYYLFSPFPWQIKNSIDVYAFCEMVIRFTLLVSLISCWIKSSNKNKRFFTFLLVLYFSMNFLWAMGTKNYGTALRHHIVTWWILVFGLPFAIEWIKTKVLVGLVSKRKRKQPI